MPRSFLITKLHGWKEGDVAEDETLSLSDDDVGLRFTTDSHTGRSDVDGQMTQMQSPSRQHSDDNSRIDAVSDKCDGENSLADSIGMSRMSVNVTFTMMHS